MKIKTREFLKNIVYSIKLTINSDEIRETWVRKELAKLTPGKRIIDVGAGEMPYKSSCKHLLYTSQDFGKYTGKNTTRGLYFGEVFNANKVDIISDIADIPVQNASFDYVLCTEVFEHIPNPFAAMKEIRRIHKKGGTLILAAPHCSLTHFYPFYFYSGFSREFYKTVLPMFGYKILALETTGNYFTWMVQELLRMPTILFRRSKIAFIFAIPFFFIALPQLVFIRIASVLYPSSSDLLWIDTYVIAVKEK